VSRPRRPGRAAAAALAAALVLGPAAAGVADGLDRLLAELSLVGLEPQEAPGFTLPALDGARVSLASQRGQVVMLYFWATW
jgi:hypothetical protein